MAGMSVWPNMLVVHPSVPAKTVPELIALLKANPGKYNMASSGSGTTIHLAGEMFKQLTGTDMVHVPYKGSAGAMQDLIAGNVHIMFDNMPSVLPACAGRQAARAGRHQPRAQQGGARRPGNHRVRAELCRRGPDGLLAVPPGVPQPIVDKLAAAGTKALEDADVKAKLAALGTDPWPMSPKGLQDRIVSEIAVWAPIVKASAAPRWTAEAAPTRS